MLYPELFRQLESVRWDMDRDIPWDKFEGDSFPTNRPRPSR
jgi:hypothetical protein